MTGDKRLPVHKQIVAGAFAGLCEILVMYPLDVVKTRFQLQRSQNPSLYSAFRGIIQTEGVGQLYRGIAAPILAEAPKRAVKFTAFEQYKQMLASADGSVPTSRAALAGTLAGMTEAVINCPFEVVKVRMQAKENVHLYRSSGHAVVTILRNEGLPALYYGFESMLWRNGVWNGMYFATINRVRSWLPPAESHSERVTNQLVAGTVAGGLATACNTPMDVAKSRIQSAPRTGAATVARDMWVLPAMAAVLREEGWRALYKGLGLRLLRLGPGGGIMLLAFEEISRIL